MTRYHLPQAAPPERRNTLRLVTDWIAGLVALACLFAAIYYLLGAATP